jgi:glycosyltransferase involved in cell wall biosynthesis
MIPCIKKIILMNKNKLFSIIMPCYNAEKYLKQSIDSILKQTYGNWELIIINDSSTDSSLKIINSFKDHRISLIDNLKNEGVAFSRNKGIKMAKGDFIAFIDSDDLWNEKKLFTQLNYLNRGYDICCSNYIKIDELGNFIKEIKDLEIIDFKSMLKSNLIPNSSAVYNVDRLGKFYQKKIGHEDYLMWLNIFKLDSSIIAYRVQENLMSYRSHSENISYSKFTAAIWTWNIYYNELELGFLQSSKSFINYIYKNFIKYFY